jgi:wyosine [tRNA(Phe)-imidazoG37] synthetase (radical SAM superfamily)
MEVEPRPFYKTDKIEEKASMKLEQAREKGELVDYVTFVPDGEPTLDANLGEEIDVLFQMASLPWMLILAKK